MHCILETLSTVAETHSGANWFEITNDQPILAAASTVVNVSAHYPQYHEA